MKGSTHAVLGALIGVSFVTNGPALDMLAAGAVCAIAALLPDVDHPHSVLRNRSGVFGDALFGRLSHRGITHSAAALVLVTTLSLLINPRLALIIGMGYASHLCADIITKHGIALFAPISARRVGLGLINTGGYVEAFIAATAFSLIGIICLPVLTGVNWYQVLEFAHSIIDRVCEERLCL